MNKTVRHGQICNEIHELYIKKNHDYGDSFSDSYTENGMVMARIRIGDKFNRFKNLIREDINVKDETIRDTLIDLANYAIMTIIELENENNDLK